MTHDRRVSTVRSVAVGLILAMALGAITAADAAGQSMPSPADDRRSSVELADRVWLWPVQPFRLEEPFAAPAHRYGSGHRGIDVRPLENQEVLAPADGDIAFSGKVAGRGIVTIDHGDGLVTTLEPIESSLEAGEHVARGAPVGAIALGGHTPAGALHFGVRLQGEYINPMLLLGGVPRAVLLPCC